MIPHSQPWISEAELAAGLRVMQSAMLSRGEEVAALEAEMAGYFGKRFALFTGNGSQAQTLILGAMGTGPGDEVVLPTYVCHKVADAVKLTGATPVLCDVGEYWNATPETVSSVCTVRTTAVVLPHVNGINAWKPAFGELGVPVIEDICQCIGDNHLKGQAGTNTSWAFTSFHGTKCIGSGEGGMLLTDDEEQFKKVLTLRRENPLYTAGTELSAAIARAQLKRYADILERREEIARRYNTGLPETLTAAYRSLGTDSMKFRYLLKIRTSHMQARTAFAAAGIHVRQGIDHLIHRDMGLDDARFPNAVSLFSNTLSIPLLPQMTDEQVAHVITTINNLYKQGEI